VPAGGRLERSAFVRACREGGAAIESALRELDRSFFAVLYRDGVLALRDPDAARDLVQETFIKVWRRCATFRGDSELLPWVRAILRNGAVERLRKTVREVPIENDDGLTAEATQRVAEISVAAGATPERAVDEAELAATFHRLWRRFQEADPLHANVLGWVVNDGLTTEDIASLLDRTPGATREFISQCRKKARVHLAEWYTLAVDAKERS